MSAIFFAVDASGHVITTASIKEAVQLSATRTIKAILDPDDFTAECKILRPMVEAGQDINHVVFNMRKRPRRTS